MRFQRNPAEAGLRAFFPLRGGQKVGAKWDIHQHGAKRNNPSILLPEARIAGIDIGPVFRGLYFENGHGRILEKNFTLRQRGGIDAADAELMGWLQALENGLPLVHGAVIDLPGAARHARAARQKRSDGTIGRLDESSRSIHVGLGPAQGFPAVSEG